MAVGKNRYNDTPIGGLPEFRGNMQGGEVFGVDDVPVWDGSKFVPGTNDALANAYGGLVTALSVGRTADGSLIDDWDVVTPLGGTPLQVTPVIATGVVTVAIDGVYQVSFSINASNLVNNENYFFELTSSGGPTGFGSHIEGSNNVNSQSTGFDLMVDGSAGGAIGVLAHSDSNSGFDIVSSSFSVTRIG